MVDDLPVPVPLKNVHIDAKVVDFVSQVTVTQEYVNHECIGVACVWHMGSHM